MKKLIALFAMVAFFAAANAQTTAPAKAETKKATTEVKADAKPACCTKANASCCKNNSTAAKACTPEQKAACAKSGGAEASADHAGCNHAKTEAKAPVAPATPAAPQTK